MEAKRFEFTTHFIPATKEYGRDACNSSDFVLVVGPLQVSVQKGSRGDGGDDVLLSHLRQDEVWQGFEISLREGSLHRPQGFVSSHLPR